MLKVYHHPRCSTCKKGLAFLIKNNVSHTAIDLTETAPTKTEIKRMLQSLETPGAIFNTSGKRYRELNIKDRKDSV